LNPVATAPGSVFVRRSSRDNDYRSLIEPGRLCSHMAARRGAV